MDEVMEIASAISKAAVVNVLFIFIFPKFSKVSFPVRANLLADLIINVNTFITRAAGYAFAHTTQRH